MHYYRLLMYVHFHRSFLPTTYILWNIDSHTQKLSIVIWTLYTTLLLNIYQKNATESTNIYWYLFWFLFSMFIRLAYVHGNYSNKTFFQVQFQVFLISIIIVVVIIIINWHVDLKIKTQSKLKTSKLSIHNAKLSLRWNGKIL